MGEQFFEVNVVDRVAHGGGGVMVCSIQDYLYGAFYDTIVAKQLHRKVSF